MDQGNYPKTKETKETTGDPRFADESKLQEIRRRINEVAADAPQVAKIALEALIRDRNLT